MGKNKILDYQLVKKKIIRISLQIIEANSSEDEIIIAGIENNGYNIAKKVCDEIKKISDKKIQLCSVKIDKKIQEKKLLCLSLMKSTKISLLLLLMMF